MFTKRNFYNFYNFEKKLGVNKSKLMGIFWWEIVRYKIFDNLYTNKSAHHLSKSYIKIINALFGKKYNNPLKIKKNKIFFICHNRALSKKNMVDNNIENISRYYSSTEKVFLHGFESMSYLNNKNKIHKNHFFIHKFFFINIIFKIFFKIYFFFFYHKKLKNYYNERLRNFFKKDLTKLIENNIIRFKSHQYIYFLLFWLKKPSLIYLVDSPNNKAIVSSANKLNIKVVEIQHGSPNKYKLNYSSSWRQEYLPNYFLSYGDHWTNYDSFLLDQKKCYVTTNFYLKKLISIKSLKKKRKIIFIDQPGIKTKLFDFIDKNITNLCKFNLFFKIHPSSSLTNKETKFLNSKKINIINNDISIYTHLCDSKYVIGSYSTVLYEALLFKCKVLSFDNNFLNSDINSFFIKNLRLNSNHIPINQDFSSIYNLNSKFNPKIYFTNDRS